MTIELILSTISTEVQNEFPEINFTDTLSATDNVRVTDKIAQVLETVNPTNNYPPEKK